MNRNYTANGSLGSIETQRDLGVQVHPSLRVATQVEKVVKKADMARLVFIGRGIEFKNRQVIAGAT